MMFLYVLVGLFVVTLVYCLVGVYSITFGFSIAQSFTYFIGFELLKDEFDGEDVETGESVIIVDRTFRVGLLPFELFITFRKINA